MQYYSRAGSLVGLDTLAQELEQPLEPMLKRFGFSLDTLADPDACISYNAFCGLVEACGEEWNCSDFGLQLGAKQNLNIFGPLGLIARLTDTVGDALRALLDNMAIHSGGYKCYVDVGVHEGKKTASLVFLPKAGSGAKRHNAELGIAVAFNVLIMLTGMPRFKPVRVEFQHKVPAEPEAAKHFFGCPVSYGNALNALYFEPELLQRPTAITDHAYAPVVMAYLDQARRLAEVDVVDATTQLIAKLAATGRCSREVVADSLHLTPKTLQRRLADNGVTFASLLDEYRRTTALELVREQTQPLLKIAHACGYSEQSSFNQAFRRWTDSTPSRYRVSRLAG